MVEQLIRDFKSAPIPLGDKSMLSYAEKLTKTPWEVREHDVETLRQAEFSDAAILDINQITGYFNFVNRLADGLGVELENYWKDEPNP